MRHAEQKILDISTHDDAVINQDQELPLLMDEVDATHGENIVRKQLEIDRRRLYDRAVAVGINGRKSVYREDVQEGYGYEFTRGDYSPMWNVLEETTQNSSLTHVQGGLGFLFPMKGFNPRAGAGSSTIKVDNSLFSGGKHGAGNVKVIKPNAKAVRKIK